MKPSSFIVRLSAATTGLLSVVVLGLSPAYAQTSTITREVQYGYNATTGLLEWERVDPNQAHCSETVYAHDEYGNRRQVKMRPCMAGANNLATAAEASFAERVTDNSFDAKATGTASERYPAGAYLTGSIARRSDGTVGQQAAGVFDPRFGVSVVQTEVASQDASRNLSKKAQYDNLGRLLKETVPVHRDGNGTVENSVEYRWYYCGSVQLTGAASSACIDASSTSVPISYASGMLVNDQGSATSSTQLFMRSAYYVEATPRGADGVAVIGARTRTHFDSLHREFAKESETYSGQWTVSIKAFDALGMEAASWVPYFGRSSATAALDPPETTTGLLRQWTASRDLLHRPVVQQRYHRGASGSAFVQLDTQLTYAGLVSSVTIPAGSAADGLARTTSARKNAIGKPVQTTDTYGATLSSAYDPVGNLVRTVDALGNTTTIEYTAVTARFKTRMTDPNQGAWSYAFDALGQLKSQTDAKAQVTALAYDEFGRLTAKTNPTQNGYWYHDRTAAGAWCAGGLGRLCESRAGQPAPSNAVIVSETVTYDALNRPQQTSTAQGGRTFTSSVGYDTQTGRIVRQTYPTGFAVTYAYSAGGGKTPGVLERVSDAADAARIFWRIDDITATSVFDARGNLLRSNLGNGLGTAHTFDALSGKAFELRAGVATGGYTNALSHKYEYDLADNLTRRTDAIKGITDSYKYDRLNRMSEYAVNSGEAAANRVVTMAYNAIGNVLAKSDVGGYGYGSRPHAVAQAAGLAYEYDANGSIVEARAPGTSGAQGRVRQMTWTAFNQPQEMSYLGKTVAFTHDQDHQRIREVTTDGAKVRTLDLLHPDNKGGLAYEREQTSVGGGAPTIENRHYISVGGAVVAVVKTSNDTAVISDASRIQYWHKDALGSIVAVSDGSGQVIEQMAYDAWGKRVRASGMADPAVDPSNGDRGFTGHEHLDELQLVHMNGRVYDPLLGKFLSIDPVVGNPNDLQTYNRYSYVYNQPTRYADATGECPVCVFVFMVGAVMAMEGNKYWSVVGKIAMIWAAPQMIEAGLGNAATLQGMNAGAAAGATETVAASTFNAGNLGNSFLAASGSSLAGGSSLGDAVRDGAFAMAFTSVGTGFKGQSPQLLVSHALIGCAQSAASGGKCGPGAMSAIIGKGTTLGLNAAGVTSPVAVGVVTIISGGTASVIGGGKFGNGAFQAGFGYVFNELATRTTCLQQGYCSKVYSNGTVCPAGKACVDSGIADMTGRQFAEGISLMADVGTLICLGICQPAVPILRAVGLAADSSKAAMTYADGDGRAAFTELAIDFGLPAAAQTGLKPFVKQEIVKEAFGQGLKAVGSSANDQVKKERP